MVLLSTIFTQQHSNNKYTHIDYQFTHFGAQSTVAGIQEALCSYGHLAVLDDLESRTKVFIEVENKCHINNFGSWKKVSHKQFLGGAKRYVQLWRWHLPDCLSWVECGGKQTFLKGRLKLSGILGWYIQMDHFISASSTAPNPLLINRWLHSSTHAIRLTKQEGSSTCKADVLCWHVTAVHMRLTLSN